LGHIRKTAQDGQFQAVRVPRRVREGCAEVELAARKSSLPTSPVAIRRDPLGPGRWRRRQAEVNERDCLALAAAFTDGHDLACIVDVDPLHANRDSEDHGVEGNDEVLFDHREQPNGLFLVVVAIDRRFLDQRIELCPAEARRLRPQRLR
jgi:hypothetical protein